MNNRLTISEYLKELGIDQVRENNKAWIEDSCIYLSYNFAPNDVVTNEDIRPIIEKCVGEPTHPNAWGALINVLARRGLLLPTGKYVKSRYGSSHASRIQLWVVAGGGRALGTGQEQSAS